MTIRFVVYLVLVLSAFVCGVSRFKKLRPAFQFLCLFMGATVTSESITRVFIMYKHTSMPVYHVYSLVQYFLFAIIFSLLAKNRKLSKLIFYSIPIMIVLGVLNTMWLQPFMTFPSNFITAMLTLHIIFSLLILKELFDDDQNISYDKVKLYLVCAIIIYSVTMVLKFGSKNYFLRMDIDEQIINSVAYYVTLAYYASITLFLLIDQKKIKAHVA